MEVNEITSMITAEHNNQNGLNKFQGHRVKMKGQGHHHNNDPSFSTKRIEVHEFIASHNSKLTILINYLNLTPHSRSRINIKGQGKSKNDRG